MLTRVTLQNNSQGVEHEPYRGGTTGSTRVDMSHRNMLTWGRHVDMSTPIFEDGCSNSFIFDEKKDRGGLTFSFSEINT